MPLTSQTHDRETSRGRTTVVAAQDTRLRLVAASHAVQQEHLQREHYQALQELSRLANRRAARRSGQLESRLVELQRKRLHIFSRLVEDVLPARECAKAASADALKQLRAAAEEAAARICAAKRELAARR